MEIPVKRVSGQFLGYESTMCMVKGEEIIVQLGHHNGRLLGQVLFPPSA